MNRRALAGGDRRRGGRGDGGHRIVAEDLGRRFLTEIAAVVVVRAAAGGQVRRRRRGAGRGRLARRRRRLRDIGLRADALLHLLERRPAEHRRVAFGHAGLAEVLDDIELGLRGGHAGDQAIAADALVLLELRALAIDLLREEVLEPARQRLRREHDVLAHQERLQVGEHLAAPLVAIVDVLRERLEDDLLDRLGDRSG